MPEATRRVEAMRQAVVVPAYAVLVEDVLVAVGTGPVV